MDDIFGTTPKVVGVPGAIDTDCGQTPVAKDVDEDVVPKNATQERATDGVKEDSGIKGQKMVVENTCTSIENTTNMEMAMGFDIEKEDAYLNASQKQEKKGNFCETINESLSNNVPQQSVGIVDEPQELVDGVDNS
ncbi:hypothetical protein L7F22_062075 [Adiantum nelumboides]|nr:hypothetical protein [Adiantum nelumboides]